MFSHYLLLTYSHEKVFLSLEKLQRYHTAGPLKTLLSSSIKRMLLYNNQECTHGILTCSLDAFILIT